jgi:hypothetical protein
MPKAGYEYTLLASIDIRSKLEKELTRVEHTLQFETAERLILGAQFRKDEINPLDYIYLAIGCQIKTISQADPMVPIVFQYLYN